MDEFAASPARQAVPLDPFSFRLYRIGRLIAPSFVNTAEAKAAAF